MVGPGQMEKSGIVTLPHDRQQLRVLPSNGSAAVLCTSRLSGTLSQSFIVVFADSQTTRTLTPSHYSSLNVHLIIKIC